MKAPIYKDGLMRVAELWRYPVKSLRGEMMEEAELRATGISGDREIVVLSAARNRVITSRTHHHLLGLQGAISPNTGNVTIDGIPWDDPAALALVARTVGEPVELIRVAGTERFDVLPLLVATDGAIAAIGLDRRRFRPNILIAGVEHLAEREWEGKNLRLGQVEIHAAQLRARCVMTTYDPDTLKQDRNVLLRIVKEFDGTMALDCSVIKPGTIHIGDEVTLLD
jgi:MOSC domain-containing protein